MTMIDDIQNLIDFMRNMNETLLNRRDEFIKNTGRLASSMGTEIEEHARTTRGVADKLQSILDESSSPVHNGSFTPRVKIVEAHNFFERLESTLARYEVDQKRLEKEVLRCQKQLNAALSVKVWRNEDKKEFVFVDDLREAIKSASK